MSCDNSYGRHLTQMLVIECGIGQEFCRLPDTEVRGTAVNDTRSLIGWSSRYFTNAATSCGGSCSSRSRPEVNA